MSTSSARSADPDLSFDPPLPSAGTTPVRAVLLDADGVLQLIGTPWFQALSEGGGETFARALLSQEGPALSGRESLRDLLERLVVELNLTTGPVAWEAVRDLRAAGYLTVLATNQQKERREWMRTVLGYDGLCDVDAYSCVLGVAKPEPGYFQAVLDATDMGAHEALFVDDNSENINAAAAVGIRTIHHPTDAGGRVLRRELIEALSI